MVLYSNKLKPEKSQKMMAVASASLLSGEEIWFFGKCNNLRPMCDRFVLTNLRALGMSQGKVAVQFLYPEITNVVADEKKETIHVESRDGASVTFKMVPKGDHPAILDAFQRGRALPPPPEAVEAYAAAAAETSAMQARNEIAKTGSWPHTKIVGGKLTGKASQAVLRQCDGVEEPWLILVSAGSGGILAAFDDRLVIIKTGALTSLMAGSFGGERTAAFHYRDVTGIEYNSGFVNGVLEILTPSYSGTTNKDFWRGSGKSRNADGNDPFTLSNCLPLGKHEYNNALKELNELRARIGRSKETVMNVTAAAAASLPSSLADELQKLSELREAGILTDEEFATAKAHLLAAG